MRHLTGRFGWMIRGQTRVFPLAERDVAVAWVPG
jgi:hypothetical protein